MAFELPTIPNFNVQPNTGPNPLDQYAKVLQLKSLMGQQSLLPLQTQGLQQEVQAKTLANQQQQMQLDSQKKLMEAITTGAFNKYAGVETPDGSGFDGAGAYQDLVKRGVLPSMAGEQVNSLLNIAKNQAEISKTMGQAGEANQNIRIKTLDALSSKLGSINDMPSADAAKALAALKQDLVQNPKAYQGLSQLEMAHLYGADLEHLPAIENLMGLESKIADFHKSKSEATSAGQKVISPATGMSPEEESIINKDVKTAKLEQPLKLQLTREEQLARQQAMQGDPNVAGQLLANGALTLTELKTRGSTPQFIEQATLAAQKQNSNYNPADEVIAEKVAASPGRNAFFGSANSLITKGGTLDQLAEIGKKIPQHDFPVLNKFDDWQKLARGKGPLAEYATKALGVADDYSKVMGGGTGTDASRDAVLKAFAQAASPEMRAGAIEGARSAVLSQRDAAIGHNQFLRRMYGEEVGGKPNPTAPGTFDWNNFAPHK